MLVARDVERLERFASELHNEAGVNVEVLARDLSDAADRAKVADRLAAGLRVLVDNAGFGTYGEFWTADLALLQSQLDMNVTAVMQLTRAALPPMLDAGTEPSSTSPASPGLFRAADRRSRRPRHR